MDKIELEIKQDENTINEISEKIELVASTNMVTNGFLQKLVAKDVIKTR